MCRYVGFVLSSILLLAGCMSTNSLGGASGYASGSAGSGGNARGESSAIQKCGTPLGTVALQEGQYTNYYHLESPLPVLRLLIAQSGCFNVVDRGRGLRSIQQEEALTGGTGQGTQRLVRSKYYLTPQIVVSDSNSGGGGLGGIASKMLGSTLGAIAGGIGVQQAEAQSVLFLTDTDSSVQVAAAEGSSRNTDFSFAGFGFGGGLGGGARGYASTDQGKVVLASLVDALNKLIDQLES